MTVSQAIESIRWGKSSLPVEYLNYLFVVGEEDYLVGEVSLAELVVCDPPTTVLKDIMRKSQVALQPTHDAEQAVETLRKYDRHHIPVVDETKTLVGIVTADDLFDVAEEEATEDIHQFGGQEALEDSYFHTPMITMLKKRAGWLAILFLGGFFSVAALESHEDALAKWSFLTVFLTMIISTGGNSGTQAASLIIRGLAINEMRLSDWWRVMLREIVMGLILGTFLGLVGFLRAYTTGLGLGVGLVVGFSVLGVVIVGVLLGSMLPFLFKKLNFDPAVVSSPFITTLVDATGILIFINVSIFVMKWWGV